MIQTKELYDIRQQLIANHIKLHSLFNELRGLQRSAHTELKKGNIKLAQDLNEFADEIQSSYASLYTQTKKLENGGN